MDDDLTNASDDDLVRLMNDSPERSGAAQDELRNRGWQFGDPAEPESPAARDDLFERELAALGAACREFVQARGDQEARLQGREGPQTPEERFVQILLCGRLTAHCARVYNLSPQAGLLDPRTLFTGRPE